MNVLELSDILIYVILGADLQILNRYLYLHLQNFLFQIVAALIKQGRGPHKGHTKRVDHFVFHGIT